MHTLKSDRIHVMFHIDYTIYANQVLMKTTMSNKRLYWNQI